VVRFALPAVAARPIRCRGKTRPGVVPAPVEPGWRWFFGTVGLGPPGLKAVAFY